MIYQVTEVIEPDFGCEGIPDGEEPCCEVRLKDENGNELTMKVEDAALYRNVITEGCRVEIRDGELVKVSESEQPLPPEWQRLYDAAKSVQRPREVSSYVSAGGVAASIEAASGSVYTGVCVDTSCTLGICAERNAIFHMLTCGEHEIRRVLALMPNGKTGAPCGACRELMAQLMPEGFREIEVMLDAESGRVIRLGQLTPEWWIS